MMKDKIIMVGIGVGITVGVVAWVSNRAEATNISCAADGCHLNSPLPGCLPGWDDASCKDTANPCNPEHIMVYKWVQADGRSIWFARYSDMRFSPTREGITPTYDNPQELRSILVLISQEQGDGQRITKRQLDCALVQITRLG